jgi:hypothetical protein
MWWPFIALAFPISLADVRSYSIPNIYLWWLLALCTPRVVFYGFGPIPRIFLIIVILALLHLVGLGMGDVKLLSIIFLYLNPLSNISFEDTCAISHVQRNCVCNLGNALETQITSENPASPQHLCWAGTLFGVKIGPLSVTIGSCVG